jgi:hypothetical protein
LSDSSAGSGGDLPVSVTVQAQREALWLLDVVPQEQLATELGVDVAHLEQLQHDPLSMGAIDCLRVAKALRAHAAALDGRRRPPGLLVSSGYVLHIAEQLERPTLRRIRPEDT